MRSHVLMYTFQCGRMSKTLYSHENLTFQWGRVPSMGIVVKAVFPPQNLMYIRFIVIRLFWSDIRQKINFIHSIIANMAFI